MPTLSTGCLLSSPISSPSFLSLNTQTPFFLSGWYS
jgi:hypothetical protein